MDIEQVYPLQPVASMNEKQQLLANIIGNPDDNTVRLVYCDWLDEYGNEEDQALAKYIRISIELHNHKLNALVRKDDKLKGIEVGYGKGNDIDTGSWYKKSIELRQQVGETWLSAREHISYSTYLERKQVLGSFIPFEQDRGFISSITCTATQFLSVCDKLIWNPSMVGEFVKKGKYVENWQLVSSRYIDTIPRPCPLTAHPIRYVNIVGTINFREQPKIEEWIHTYAPNYGIGMELIDT